MGLDTVIEISLYAALLILVLVMRWWQSSKTGPQAMQVRSLQKLKPVVTTGKKSSRKWAKVVPKLSKSDCINWRRATDPPVIDLRPAFIAVPEPTREEPVVAAPPNSPCGPSDTAYWAYGLDPSFDTYLAASPDVDFERRRMYVKKQVTEGEVMMKMSTYDVCQIFVHGIEYHYVCDGGTTSWDLPQELVDSISDWYLVMPKSRRKKLFPSVDPPLPLPHEPDPVPLFN